MYRLSRFRAVLLPLIAAATAVTAFAQKPVQDLDPTLILISIDGFRADYLEIHKPKNLNKLARRGVRAQWMVPSFPTKTFPNHYTIATGLYPAHHGIVANNMYDPEFDAVFTLGKREEVENPRWWGGEPIWVTAERQGRRAGAFFFPGTETAIGGTRPAYWKHYDGDIPNKTRVDTLLRWLDLPATRRPALLTIYFSDVDDAGHRYSPLARKTGKAVRNVDRIFGRLLKGLRKRRIEDKVNLIVVSDHGMAPVPGSNQIILDEMFDARDAKHVFWVGEIVQIFPKPGRADAIFRSIKENLPGNAGIYRKGDLPERFRFAGHRRIAPILVLPDEGWVLTTRERFEKRKKEGRLDDTGGSHGYDNELESMRALFIGSGPAFRKNHVVPPFRNVDVYNLMCKILGLNPAPNDGDPKTIESLLAEPG